jgi:hypothetical protein
MIFFFCEAHYYVTLRTWKKMTPVCDGQSRTKPPLTKAQQSLLARTVAMHRAPALSGASRAVISAEYAPSSFTQPARCRELIIEVHMSQADLNCWPGKGTRDQTNSHEKVYMVVLLRL